METYIVDSFTNKPFRGNPAGVCILNASLSEANMLTIAQELNLSETAFIQQKEKNNCYSIRYFSPVMEIPLCGHATLASAKVLFEYSNINEIQFTTIQNLSLTAKKTGNEITMEFPVYETKPSKVPPALLEALDITEINNCEYNKETNILLLEISDSRILANLTPNYQKLLKSHNTINGVVVTAATSEKYDFHSRYFWPWSGSNEDPVTGATHTFLTKYWSKRLNKTKMKSFQASKRTGFMEVELIENNKLLIKSNAVIVFKGIFIF